MPFEIKDVDKKFYEERLQDFLPEKILDSHTHIWLDRLVNAGDSAAGKIQAWPLKVAKENSIEDLVAGYKRYFPDKDVTPLFCPGNVTSKSSIENLNEYCSSSAAEYNYPFLTLTNPDWDAAKVEAAIQRDNSIGVKVYLTFAPDYIPVDEIRIFDFLPRHHLEVLNKNGWAALLHIARPGRLGDPLNLAQMLEIEERYPNVKLIIAHVGRAYCPEDVGNAFELLKDTKNMVFDLAANTNADVFEQLINTVGPKRILFGSDEPISRMRMKRVCENGKYINLIAKGAYGDVSNDPHMREVSKEESDTFSFFMYEIIDAFRQAAHRTGLSRVDIEDVFYNNARNLIESVKQS